MLTYTTCATSNFLDSRQHWGTLGNNGCMVTEFFWISCSIIFAHFLSYHFLSKIPAAELPLRMSIYSYTFDFDTFKNDTFESVWVDRHPHSVIILWCRFTVMPFFTYSMIGFVQKNDCAHFSKYLSNSQMRHPILSICSKGKWKGAESEVIKYLRSPIHTRLWQH